MLTVTSAAMAVLFLASLSFRSSSPAFLAPITKDLSTHKHALSVFLNTPPRATNLLLDLGAAATLVDCRAARSWPARKNEPPGRPAIGSLSMPVTDGSNPGRLGSVPEFAFSCNKSSSSLKGLVKGAAGLAGLGRSNLSIPAQVSNSSSADLVFALCLSGSPSAPGVAFFGSAGPYNFLPRTDLSKYLDHTPLLSNNPTVSRKDHPIDKSTEYFIGLTSIKVNGKDIDFDRSLLGIDRRGRGGTRLSTVVPYTLLQTSIFEALMWAFAKESAALNLTAARPAKPFRLCYEADEVSASRTGPAVPIVDLVLGPGGESLWRIFGSNSMVRVYRDRGRVDVWCLGFVDGGARPEGAMVVIGAHQMEDNLLQFDLDSGMLGFSSSALVRGTTCSNFNFTTNPNLR